MWHGFPPPVGAQPCLARLRMLAAALSFDAVAGRDPPSPLLQNRKTSLAPLRLRQSGSPSRPFLSIL
jgi:hypothetical protein